MRFQKMPVIARWTIGFSFLNLVLFTVCRFVFYYFCASGINSEFRSAAFLRGLEFDLCVISWVAFVPLLLDLFRQLFAIRSDFIIKVCRFWLFTTSILCLFTSVTDIPYFRQFGNHLGVQAFLWNNSPVFVFKLIFSTIAYWGFILLFLALLVPLFVVGKKMYRIHPDESSKSFGTVMYVILILAAVMGARGRIAERTALHKGHAIVSQDPFINQLALNANFTFWPEVFSSGKTEYRIPEDIDSSFAFAKEYLGINHTNKRDLSRQITGTVSGKPNIVIVIMESMCLFKMGYYNGKKLTPHFDSLARQSLFFSNFFSSGIHTFNGIFSTLTGHPGFPGEHLLENFSDKPFGGLGEIFRERGYATTFYTTHDPHFDNMKGFATVNGFQQFVSQEDFNSEEVGGTLGVPDHILFDKFLGIADQSKDRPFLSVLLTSSDHGPWYVPDNIPFKPQGENERENATLYADWAIGRFVKMSKQKSWYPNTIFFFLGDHGLSMGHTYEMPLAFHHVPFVIHGSVVDPDTNVYPASQADVLATVMGLAGGAYEDRSMGLDLVKKKHGFVIFSADNKRGCVDSSGNYYFETDEGKQKYLRRYQNLDWNNYYVIKQKYADSLAKKMKALFDCEEYLLRQGATGNSD